MKNKDQILLESIYERILLETRNSAFLRELDPLLDRWKEIQSKIKGNIPSYQYNADGEPYDKPDSGQKIDKKDLPVYYQNTKKTKSDLFDTDHPNLRRIYFKQTDAEVELEKELLRVFQKYANQKYFNSDVLLTHDLAYPAYASVGVSDYSTQQKTEEHYLKNENKIHKNVLSCKGRDINRVSTRNIGTYGMIVKGHVIFASSNDLSSQTTRVAPKFIHDFFKNSGIPKRASIVNVHDKEEYNTSIKLKQKIRERRQEPPMSEEEKNEILNKVVLDKNDNPSMAEVLLGNWKIDSWFFSMFRDNDGSKYPYPYNFWKKAYESNIQKPVYYFELNSDNPPVKVDLSEYFKQ